jgi:hypothetical protein
VQHLSIRGRGRFRVAWEGGERKLTSLPIESHYLGGGRGATGVIRVDQGGQGQPGQGKHRQGVSVLREAMQRPARQVRV